MKYLEASCLLEPELLSTLRTEAATLMPDAQTFAAHLVQEGTLTPYQAKHLLAGHSQGFFLGKYKIL